jgi:hypothetical protein
MRRTANLTLGLSLVLLSSFVISQVPATAGMITLPDQSSTFGGNVRGYWFTAPVDFTITGLGVPTDASTGPQSIELLRLNVDPPLYSGSTNDFTSLFRIVNDSTPGLIAVNIPVASGDILGVLGYRDTINSYGPGDFQSSIFGSMITLRRFGTQATLQSGPAQNVWTESGGSISRVNLEYGPAGAAVVPEPSTYLAGIVALAMIAGFRRKRT